MAPTLPGSQGPATLPGSQSPAPKYDFDDPDALFEPAEFRPEPVKNIWGRRRVALLANGDLPMRAEYAEPVACAVCGQPTTGKYGVCYANPACMAEYQRRAKANSQKPKAESRNNPGGAGALPSSGPNTPRAADNTFDAEARPSALAESDTGQGRTGSPRPAWAPAATDTGGTPVPHQNTGRMPVPQQEVGMGWSQERREKFMATMAAKRAGRPPRRSPGAKPGNPKSEIRNPKSEKPRPAGAPAAAGVPRIVGRIGDCLVADDGVYRRIGDEEVQELYDVLSRLIERQ